MRCQFPSCSSAGMKGKHGNTSGSSAILFHWSPLPWLRSPIKDSEVTRRIFNHGVTALRALAAKQGWQIQEQAALVSASGPEGMLSIAAPARDLKLATIELEHSHPLGRLWDIDILTPEGEILSRRDYSLPPRRCLLCEQSAAVCARGKTHQLTDLLNRMEALLNDVDACNVN